MEHNGSHATFLDLDISRFTYKISNKGDVFNFHIACYSFTMSEVVRLKDVLPVANNLLHRMINQGASKKMHLKQIKKRIP